MLAYSKFSIVRNSCGSFFSSIAMAKMFRTLQNSHKISIEKMEMGHAVCVTITGYGAVVA